MVREEVAQARASERAVTRCGCHSWGPRRTGLGERGARGRTMQLWTAAGGAARGVAWRASRNQMRQGAGLVGGRTRRGVADCRSATRSRTSRPLSGLSTASCHIRPLSHRSDGSGTLGRALHIGVACRGAETRRAKAGASGEFGRGLGYSQGVRSCWKVEAGQRAQAGWAAVGSSDILPRPPDDSTPPTAPVRLLAFYDSGLHEAFGTLPAQSGTPRGRARPRGVLIGPAHSHCLGWDRQ